MNAEVYTPCFGRGKGMSEGTWREGRVRAGSGLPKVMGILAKDPRARVLLLLPWIALGVRQNRGSACACHCLLLLVLLPLLFLLPSRRHRRGPSTFSARVPSSMESVARARVSLNGTYGLYYTLYPRGVRCSFFQASFPWVRLLTTRTIKDDAFRDIMQT